MSSDDKALSDTFTNSSENSSRSQTLSENSECERSDSSQNSSGTKSPSSKWRRSPRSRRLSRDRRTSPPTIVSDDSGRNTTLEITIIRPRTKSASPESRKDTELSDRSRARSSSPKYSDTKSIREKKATNSVRSSRSRGSSRLNSTFKSKSKCSMRSKSEPKPNSRNPSTTAKRRSRSNGAHGKAKRGASYILFLTSSPAGSKSKSSSTKRRSRSSRPKSESKSKSKVRSRSKSKTKSSSTKRRSRSSRSKSKSKARSTSSKSARSVSSSRNRVSKKKNKSVRRRKIEDKSESKCSLSSKSEPKAKSRAKSEARKKSRATARSKSKKQSSVTKRRSRSTRSKSDSKSKSMTRSTSSKSARSASSSKNRVPKKRSRSVRRRKVEDSAKERLKKKAVRRSSFPGRKVTFDSESKRSAKKKDNSRKKTNSASSTRSKSQSRSRIGAKISAKRPSCRTASKKKKTSAVASSTKSKSSRSSRTSSKGGVTSSRSVSVRVLGATNSPPRSSHYSKRSRSVGATSARRTVAPSGRNSPLIEMIPGKYKALLPVPQAPPSQIPSTAYVQLSPDQMQGLAQMMSKEFPPFQDSPITPPAPVFSSMTPLKSATAPLALQEQQRTEQYSPLVKPTPEKNQIVAKVPSTSTAKTVPPSAAQPSKSDSVSSSEKSRPSWLCPDSCPCTRPMEKPGNSTSGRTSSSRRYRKKGISKKSRKTKRSDTSAKKQKSSDVKLEAQKAPEGSQTQPKSVTTTLPPKGPVISRMRTIPDGKVAVNAPFVNSQSIPILIINEGPSPFAWSLKTSRPQLFEATPAFGIVEPYGSMYSFVSFKGFTGGEQPKESDKISVLWTDVAKGTAFSLSLFDKNEALIGKKMIKVEYNG